MNWLVDILCKALGFDTLMVDSSSLLEREFQSPSRRRCRKERKTYIQIFKF